MSDTDLIAQELRQNLEGKVEPERIDTMISQLKKTTVASYAANAGGGGVLFYALVTVHTAGREFEGNAGGFFGFGPYYGQGTVYTADLNNLLNHTESFSVSFNPAYMNVVFYDGGSNILGHFQGLGGGSIVGTGAGTGHW